jgi:glycosyltransferase involved in cell wall biosynthesis
MRTLACVDPKKAMSRDFDRESMAGKIKLLHVITGLTTGGAERALYNLLKGGLSERLNSHIISLKDDGTIGRRIRALGVPVTTLDMLGGWPSLSGLTKLRRIVREFQPDIIQGWMYHGNVAAILARTMSSRRPILVWTIHSSLYDLNHEGPITRQVIRANRWFSSAPDALVYVSWLARKRHEEFGFAPQNGRIIPNGIDVQQFSFSSASRQRVRSELGIPQDAPVVGHVARLHPMKDHQSFLQAATDISRRYPETHFLLCGRDVLLEESSLAQLIPVHVQDRFHLLGERSDVADLMSAMDIFCQSSWSEAFPIVLGEAMVTQVPCVATDVGDSATIIGDTGVVVPPRDVTALVDGIERLLRMPVEERRTMGASARVRIQANYTLEAVVDQHAELYEKLMQQEGER